MRTKKIRTLILSVFLLCALLLASCGSAKGGSVSSEPAAPAVESASESTATAEVTTPEPAEAEVPAPAEETPEPKPEPEEPSYDVIPESYACTIRVSINPQVLLYLDENYSVVGICYENEDAIDAYAESELVGMTLESAVDTLIEGAQEKGYLAEEPSVSITLEDVADSTAITDDTVLREARDLAKASLEKIESEGTVETVISEEVQSVNHIEKTMVTCPDCEGSGIFCPGDTDTSRDVRYPSCHGTCIVKCLNPICNNGKCTRCGGTGKSTCFGCNGTGVNSVDGATCNHCGGSGKERCEYCHGTGNCERCNGTGQIPCLFQDLHTECPTCGGTGQVEM